MTMINILEPGMASRILDGDGIMIAVLKFKRGEVFARRLDWISYPWQLITDPNPPADVYWPPPGEDDWFSQDGWIVRIISKSTDEVRFYVGAEYRIEWVPSPLGEIHRLRRSAASWFWRLVGAVGRSSAGIDHPKPLLQDLD